METTMRMSGQCADRARGLAQREEVRSASLEQMPVPGGE
jgi:hypothetical protein